MVCERLPGEKAFEGSPGGDFTVLNAAKGGKGAGLALRKGLTAIFFEKSTER